MVRPVTAIAGVLVVLALLIAPYVQPWLAQRSQLADGRAQVDQLQKDVATLSAQTQRWDDPAYVRAQARDRLHFVMPGEVGYVVLDDAAKAPVSTDPRVAAASLQGAASTQPWYSTLWQSVQKAGTIRATP
jgi:cell division protein FtsB